MTPGLRAKVLSEWRGYGEPAAPADRTRAVGQTIEEVMRGLGLEERVTEFQIVSAWKEIVGEWFALHTCPERIRDGVLYVRVVQSSVHFELDRNWKPTIVKKLKARIGAGRVREIRFRVG
jgi:predicted nucleic acid-binding Zn ribbon protein